MYVSIYISKTNVKDTVDVTVVGKPCLHSLFDGTDLMELGLSKKPFFPQKTCLKPLSSFIASGFFVFN